MAQKNLPLEKLICPICRGILIEPVVMPCSHALCFECFDGTMEMANLTCPLCRKRVGGWLRTVKRQGKLIDLSLWNYIQQNFSEYVKAKKLGEDDCIEEELEETKPPPVQISEPGEIRKEFEKSQALLEEEMKKQHDKEFKASEELIKKLQEEERKRQECELEDERIARELQEKLQQEMAIESMQSEGKVPSDGQQLLDNKENKQGASGSLTPRGPMDLFLRPRHSSKSNTPCLDSFKREDTAVENNGRCDSITPETLHFKPINIVPLTPPKTLSDGRILKVPPIRSTPAKNLFFDNLSTASSRSSPQLSKQLAGLKMDRKNVQSKSRQIISIPKELSAFRGVQDKQSKLNFVFSGAQRKGNVYPTSTTTSNALSQEVNQQENSLTGGLGLELQQVDQIQSSSTDAMDSDDGALHISKVQPPSPDLFESDDSEADAFKNNNDYVNNFQTEQEHQDFIVAQKLQATFDSEDRRVDRTRGSNLAYGFRNRTKSLTGVTKKRSTRKGQPTVKEAFRFAAQRFSQ